jgi:ATP-binding cassette subfamily F protein 3
MFQIKNLTYGIADRLLLNQINYTISPGKRVALVGPNGAGKTTLLKIIIGDTEAFEGEIITPKKYKLGYLPQEEIEFSGTSILETVLCGEQDIRQLETQITAIHHQLDNLKQPPEQLLNQLSRLEQEYESLDGYQLENRAKQVLLGLGFSRDDFSRPLNEFSGGWRMRVYLTIILIKKPDLLLLDEPTNHLDLPSLEWLEQYLLGFSGSIILVSHDRFFIDRLSNEIIELEHGALTSYPGNYHYFQMQKQANLELKEKKYKEQQDFLKQQDRFIERFRYKNTKAKQVQSRLKMLEKVERIEQPAEKYKVNFSIHIHENSYHDVLKIQDLYFKYDQDWVLEDVSFQLFRGEKAAMVGLNGAGKTTFTKLINSQLSPQQGSMVLGQRVKLGYYAQHQVDALDLDKTIYDEIAAHAATPQIPNIRNVLGLFQLRGDDVFKKIRVLSGGEKARVSLAKILLSPVNFLIMDEPTNHLDQLSREALENALKNYQGTLLLISHDRYFLDQIVNRVIEIRQHRLYEFSGNYSYYLEKRQQITAAAINDNNSNIELTAAGEKTTKPSKEHKRLMAQVRQQFSKDRNQLQKRISQLEAEIMQLESRKKEIELQMTRTETYQDSKQVIALQKELAEIQERLPLADSEWEHSQLKLDEIHQHIKTANENPAAVNGD